MADVVGHVDPHGRRADHGPRRRRRAAACRPGWRPSRPWCCWCATRTVRATPPRPLARRAARRRASGSQLDDRVDISFGRRATDWELKGVPVRIEVGPRDLAEGEVTLVRRDTGEQGAAWPSARSPRAVADAARGRSRPTCSPTATERRDARTVDVHDARRGHEAGSRGFARVPWRPWARRARRRLAPRAITVRCLQRADGCVPADEDEPGLVAFVARAY